MSLQSDIQKIYIAYFNRPADAAGLKYWTDQVSAGGASLSDLTRAFAATQEYADLYASTSTAGVITAVYTNLFGRSPEPEGLAFWKGELENGRASIADIAYRTLNGAAGTDKTAIDNKASAAELFTSSKGGAADYDGAKLQQARDWLTAIDHTPGSLQTAKLGIDDIYLPPDISGPARIFTYSIWTEREQGYGKNTGEIGEHVVKDFVLGRDAIKIIDQTGATISVPGPTYVVDTGDLSLAPSKKEALQTSIFVAMASGKTTQEYDWAPLMAGESAIVTFLYHGVRNAFLFVDDGSPTPDWGMGGNGPGTVWWHLNNDLTVDLTGIKGLKTASDGVSLDGWLFV
ncbi:DUF4214 domain-containing protein [Devosia sp. FJ2-5-3]|uniref:DUF4214 domain-containing protein n=1 Tax=Devosia sp. FJ2-5-3 TaxID=2976680 RepID=UPI0023D7CE78|nr:DUF4214 domain-containing protein [Devosia sp. FJ2-5-3]WEJ57004.1 DUF4214 domain-containing protein [Devosia sp. FJ2-5-3]